MFAARAHRWLATFLRQYRMMRAKKHGAGPADVRTSLHYAACGAWLASGKLGPSPLRLVRWLGT
jgi:hypothetical protein